MNPYTRLLATLVVLAQGSTPAGAQEPSDSVRAAISRSLPLIQKGAAGHRENRTCFACHNQGVPILAVVTARSRGFEIDDEELKKHMGFISTFLGKNRANYLKGKGQGGQVDTAGYALWSLELGGWKPDETTAAVSEYFLLYNKDLDRWNVSSNRPPSEGSRFTAAYLALRGLKTFGGADQKARIEEKTAKVRDWILKTPAKDTEDQVFRLWAMRYASAPPKDVQAAALTLKESQQEDGGWRQTDSLKSDAYATGTVLVALHEAGGMGPDDPVYQRGVKHLLSTQLPDGSWHVRSRSKPFQLYFETGFPHGKDQFISIAASSWAVTALALSARP